MIAIKDTIVTKDSVAQRANVTHAPTTAIVQMAMLVIRVLAIKNALLVKSVALVLLAPKDSVESVFPATQTSIALLDTHASSKIISITALSIRSLALPVGIVVVEWLVMQVQSAK